MSGAATAGQSDPAATPGGQSPASERCRLALGLGCDRGTPYETLAQAIDEALAQAGASWSAVVALASIDLKADEAAMQQLADTRRMPIRFYPAAVLAGVEVPNPSEVVRKYTGTPSVSEAAALLAAGEVLAHPRQAAGPGAGQDAGQDAGATGRHTEAGAEPSVMPAGPPSGWQHVSALSFRQMQASCAQPASMSALCVEKHKLRGPDGRNATVSVARLP